MSKQGLLKLTNDYIFKRTFGYKGEEEVTKVFLQDLLKIPNKTNRIRSKHHNRKRDNYR